MGKPDLDVDARWIVLVALFYGCASGAVTAAAILGIGGVVELEWPVALGGAIGGAFYGAFVGGILGLLCGCVLGAWSGVRTGLGPAERARTFPAVTVVTLAVFFGVVLWRVDDSRGSLAWIAASSIPVAGLGAWRLAPRYIRHIEWMEARGLLRGSPGPTKDPGR